MALFPNGLANEIVNSIKGKITNQNAASQFMQELGHAIARYLTKNTQVVYAWSGIQPGSPPVPDPVVAYTTNQVVGDFICSPTMATDPVMHGIILGKQITDGIRTFKIMPAQGWAVPPGGFLCAPAIILPPYPQRDTYRYWLRQSEVILKFYKMWIRPEALMGTHGQFLAPPGAGSQMLFIS
jgi:hypothetical protein